MLVEQQQISMSPPQNKLETAPLLSSSTVFHDEQVEASTTYHTRCTTPWIRVVILCMGIAVTANVGVYLFLAPKIRLFESIICKDYYLRAEPSLISGDGSVPEQFCKVSVVQDGLATIVGWQLFFDSIPAILLPIPYGYLADKYGRKWIAVLALLSYTLSCASVLFIVRPYSSWHVQ